MSSKKESFDLGREIGLNGTPADIKNETRTLKARFDSGDSMASLEIMRLWEGFSDGACEAFLQNRPENIQYLAGTEVRWLNSPPIFDKALLDLLRMSRNPDETAVLAVDKLDDFQKQKILDRVLLSVIHNSKAYTRAIPLALLKAGAHEPFFPEGTPPGIKEIVEEAKSAREFKENKEDFGDNQRALNERARKSPKPVIIAPKPPQSSI